MKSVACPVSLYRFHGAQMTRLGRQMTTASFAVLEKVYQDAALPDSWRSRREEAYSRGFLRAAAQAYTIQEFPHAVEAMREAVRRDPGLCADDGERAARLAAGWANHKKTSDPLTFLAAFYEHLPEELAVLRRRRRRDLAQQALHLAFAAYAQGEMATVRRRIGQAVRYNPRVLLDRGVLSILAQAGVSGSRAMNQPTVALSHDWTAQSAPSGGKR
jgi:hypothetical protein